MRHPPLVPGHGLGRAQRIQDGFLGRLGHALEQRVHVRVGEPARVQDLGLAVGHGIGGAEGQKEIAAAVEAKPADPAPACLL